MRLCGPPCPRFLYYNLPLDVIEAMTYGREWQLGYDKLPPLPWFLGEIAYRLTGHDASLYALSQAAVIVAFIAVWMTARPLVGAAGALAALLIIDGMHYFNLSAVKFNHNVIEMPLWALAGFAFHAGLRQGKLSPLDFARRRARASRWWAKYFVVILAAPLALFLLLDPDARRRLAAPGPWIAAIVTLVCGRPESLLAVAAWLAAVRLCGSARRGAERRARSSHPSARSFSAARPSFSFRLC